MRHISNYGTRACVSGLIGEGGLLITAQGEAERGVETEMTTIVDCEKTQLIGTRRG